MVEASWIQLGVGLVVWTVTIAVAWTKFGGRIDMLELRISNVEKAIASIAETLSALTKNETQMALMQQSVTALQKETATLHETVELMRRGEGFITGPRRGNIQGEYSRVGPA